jgi:hypothetical protein
MRWISESDSNVEELEQFLRQIGNDVPVDSLEGIFDLPLESDKFALPCIPLMNTVETTKNDAEERPQEWPWNGWKFEDYSKKFYDYLNYIF